MIDEDLIVSSNDLILITGANGFIGTRVVKKLVDHGFKNLRCFVRPTSDLTSLNRVIGSLNDTKFEIVKGNLLSHDDCKIASRGVSVIIHLAAGIENTFPGSFMNSAITTRNLLEATLKEKKLKRFVNVSSFAVYSNLNIRRGGLLDESCEIETKPMERSEPYCFGKLMQDEIVLEYSRKYDIPYVIVRPGAVFGPGKGITARVGIDTFGIFLHLGGSNKIPFTYVDNCADAMVLSGIKKGIDNEVFNIVDDNLPRSKDYLKQYKAMVGHFYSLSIPYGIFYILCFLWEKYSKWSGGQLPPAFNRRRCSTYWKGNRYSNEKLKKRVGWRPEIAFDDALKLYFKSFKSKN